MTSEMKIVKGDDDMWQDIIDAAWISGTAHSKSG